MPTWVSPIAGLLGSQVVGRGLGAVLGTAIAGRLATRIDGRPLTPYEHRTITSRHTGDLGGRLADLAVEASSLVGIVAARKAARGTTMGARRVDHADWVEVLQRVGAVLVAVGAIAKLIADLVGDRDRVASESSAWRTGRNRR